MLTFNASRRCILESTFSLLLDTVSRQYIRAWFDCPRTPRLLQRLPKRTWVGAVLNRRSAFAIMPRTARSHDSFVQVRPCRDGQGAFNLASATMRLADFLIRLFEQGNVCLERGPLAAEEGDREIIPILSERERIVAADFPGSAPAVDLPAALWAARQFYAACQVVLYREAPIEAVRKQLGIAPPAGEAAAQHYSVDLVYRFLVDLDRLLATLSLDDPVREIIRAWGNRWPLSSVGIKGVEPQRVEELLAHPALRQAYIDRIIQHRDSGRLQHVQVSDLVRAALGAQGWAQSAWCTVGPTFGAAAANRAV